MTKTITPLILGVGVGTLATAAVFGLRTAGLEQSPAMPALSGRANEIVIPAATPSETQTRAAAIDQDVRDALRAIDRPADLRTAALELLGSVGRDLDAISSIAAALPEADRMNFTFDAIASGAAADPSVAISEALALDDIPARAEAIRRVAGVLGDLDPIAALQYERSIENAELGAAFRNAVFERWANSDPDAFLAFLREAQPADVRGAVDALTALAASRPEALLERVDELPQSIRLNAEVAAVGFLVMSDTERALTHIASMPVGQSRDILFLTAARSYALHDIDAALAWADALDPPSPSATSGVFEVLAKTDPIRSADELIGRLANSGSFNGVDTYSVLRVLSSGPPALTPVVADRFAGVDDAAAASMLARFIGEWSFIDPDGAYSWAMANTERLTRQAVIEMARSLGTARPELAQLAAERIPVQMRETWIGTAANEMARVSLDRALLFISRYEGQPVYDEALASAMRGLIDTGNVENPNSVAQFLDGQSDSVRAESVAVVANVWAERDPRAAARWAERVALAEADEDRRAAAFENVARRWAERDPRAAERWVLDLTRGQARDRALAGVLQETAHTGSIDSRLIEAFDSNSSAQRSLGQAMCGLGASAPDLGRELIETHVTEPALRAQAQENLIQGISRRVECRGSGRVTFR